MTTNSEDEAAVRAGLAAFRHAGPHREESVAWESCTIAIRAALAKRDEMVGTWEQGREAAASRVFKGRREFLTFDDAVNAIRSLTYTPTPAGLPANQDQQMVADMEAKDRKATDHFVEPTEMVGAPSHPTLSHTPTPQPTSDSAGVVCPHCNLRVTKACSTWDACNCRLREPSPDPTATKEGERKGCNCAKRGGPAEFTCNKCIASLGTTPAEKPLAVDLEAAEKWLTYQEQQANSDFNAKQGFKLCRGFIAEVRRLRIEVQEKDELLFAYESVRAPHHFENEAAAMQSERDAAVARAEKAETELNKLLHPKNMVEASAAVARINAATQHVVLGDQSIGITGAERSGRA